jgi:hypothetical protein
MDSAVRRKAQYIAEYFIKLCLYLGNGVTVTNNSRRHINRLQQNDFLYVKHGRHMHGYAMVYLLDKYIDHSVIKLDVCPVIWFANFKYDDDKYISVELEYGQNGECKSVYLELVDSDELESSYMMIKQNVVFVSDFEHILTYNDFFDEFESKVKAMRDAQNTGVIDTMNRFYSEKIGDPDVHLPLNPF